MILFYWLILVLVAHKMFTVRLPLIQLLSKIVAMLKYLFPLLLLLLNVKTACRYIVQPGGGLILSFEIFNCLDENPQILIGFTLVLI